MSNKKVPNVVVIIFVSCLIAANITATKIANLWGLNLPAGIIIFPITYIIGDVVTEVFGYKEMKKIIYLGFLANLITSIVINLTILFPPAPFWELQTEYTSVLGQSLMILLASFSGYLAGSLLNSWSMEKIKGITKGRHLWLRIIASTILGEGVDTFLFIVIAFSSIFDKAHLVDMVITQWIVKVGYETLATPITSLVVRKVKAATGIK